jgi:hypothetical protein
MTKKNESINFGGTEIPTLIDKIKADTEIMAEAFYRIGSNLAELKEEFMALATAERKQLGNWSGFCKRELGFSKQHVSNLMRGAVAYENLKSSTTVDVLPATENMIRPLTRYNDNPELQRKLWQRAVDMADGGLPREQDIIKVLAEQLDKENQENSRKARERVRQKFEEAFKQKFEEASKQNASDAGYDDSSNQSNESTGFDWDEWDREQEAKGPADGGKNIRLCQFLDKLDTMRSHELHAVSEIMKAGFRAMAMKAHPDHGGDADDMKALVAGKELIQTMIQIPGLPIAKPETEGKEEHKPKTTAKVYPIIKAA